MTLSIPRYAGGVWRSSAWTGAGKAAPTHGAVALQEEFSHYMGAGPRQRSEEGRGSKNGSKRRRLHPRVVLNPES